MKKAALCLLALAVLAMPGCFNPFAVDPAQAERAVLDQRLKDTDSRLQEAQAKLEALSREAKASGSPVLLAAAEALATSVSELRQDRVQTLAAKEALPKPTTDWNGVLSLAEGAAGLGGFGWIVALIRAGKKAKETYESQIATHQSHFTAAVAGIQDFSQDLPPEMKAKLYEKLKDAAEEHTDDPLAMALQVAIAKTKLRGSV